MGKHKIRGVGVRVLEQIRSMHKLGMVLNISQTIDLFRVVIVGGGKPVVQGAKGNKWWQWR